MHPFLYVYFVMPSQFMQFGHISQFAHGSVRFGAVESQLTLVTYGGNYQFGQFADRDFLACTYINMSVTNIFITLFVGVFEVYMLHDEDAGICHFFAPEEFAKRCACTP